MQIGQEKHGMITLNQFLFQLYTKRQITMDVAIKVSQDPDELRKMMMNVGDEKKRDPSQRRAKV